MTNGFGDSLDAPSAGEMLEFLKALPPDDAEHGAAWLTDASGNSLEFEVAGNLAFTSASGTRHLCRVSVERVVELWSLLASGDHAALEREPWQPGPRPPLSPDERRAHELRFAEFGRTQDRNFYDRLGVEDPSSPCRQPGCARGRVAQSTLCRVHHYENVLGKPCTFRD